MARITGEQGASLSSRLQQYLDSAGGDLSSAQLQNLINEYLQGADELTTVSGVSASGIYKRFNEFDKVEGRQEVVTTGLWSGGRGSLETFFTSSEQTGSVSGKYYWNVYQANPNEGDGSYDDGAETQLSVAYGHSVGSGSVPLNFNDDALFPTRTTYGQYKSLLLQPVDDKFTFLGEYDSDDIYVINISRSRYRERVDPGNISLMISGSSGSFEFIDDSGMKFENELGVSGKVFNIVEGNLLLGTQNDSVVLNTTDSAGRGFGLFYPDHGIIILNPTAMHDKIGSVADIDGVEQVAPVLVPSGGWTSGDTDIANHALVYNMVKLGGDLEGRRKENISTSHYFVRATNREFNFSNNPTFADRTTGEFVEESFERDPKVFITSIGLYDSSNEMLAIAKTSQPVAKSFDKEVLVKVKISF